jgi:hypothetical protein
MRTFETEDVKVRLTTVVAVIAERHDLHSRVIRRHWCAGDLFVELRPCKRGVQDSNGAQRAAREARRAHKVPKALIVHRVPARQDAALGSRIEKVLLAHGTVLVHRALDATMVALQLHGIAAPARVTVKESFSSPNPADPAAVAMKWCLR